MFYTVLGCGVVVILAMVKDANGTINLIRIVVTVRGFTWIVKKITESINRDASEIINFTGWSIAGVSIIKILNNAVLGVKPVTDSISKVSSGIQKLGLWFDKLGVWLDKLTFWE